MTLPRTSCDGPITVTRDGLRVAIRLSPRAKADRLLALTATAEGGHANEALLQLLARASHLPRRDLAMVAGTASRNKTIRVAGDPHRLLTKLAGEVASLPGS
jgi:uncharacterized protein